MSRAKDDPVKIRLGQGDSAMVVRSDGTFEAFVAKSDDPAATAGATAVVMFMKLVNRPDLVMLAVQAAEAGAQVTTIEIPTAEPQRKPN